MKQRVPPGRVCRLVGLFSLAASTSASGLTITEIHYQPPAGGPNLQFVEVYNDAATVLDISGYTFTEGIQFSFPEGTFLPGRSYIVVCADVAAVEARYGITNAIGNFVGALENHGETLKLANASGIELVEVSYRDRGKWPAAPKGTGHALSLRQPNLDPDDGPNWVPSGELGGTPGRRNFPPSTAGFEDTEIIARGAVWKYQKGTAEFSSPITAWRQIGYNDAAWLQGPTGIGYADGDDATELLDMQNSYWSIAARKSFTLTAPEIAAIQSLVLSIRFDDGFICYLNGEEVERDFLGNDGENTPFNTPAGLHEADVENEYPLDKTKLRVGTNVLAIQVHNNQIGSSDLSLIPRLISRRTIAPGSTGGPPVVINELFSRTDGARWVELYNPGAAAIDVGGFHLSNDPSNLGLATLAAASISAEGFLTLTEADLGFPLAGPEVLVFLSRPDLSGVVDAHLFETPETPDRIGTSDARFPDGGSSWVFSDTPTPGAPNRLDVETNVVINEIMYDVLESRDATGGAVDVRPGEYIELHNRGAAAVSLDGWAFTKGIDFAFPSGTTLEPGQYLVVAEDPAYIKATYGLSTVLGPWEGGLQNNGETIRLEDALGNTANEVKYFGGGEWSDRADGKGSSLELIDPWQDNSVGSAWEGSDETAKAPWVQLSYTGSYSSSGESVFHFTPMQDGSFLFDDVEILRGATNYISNPGFEANTSPWVIQGSLVHSRRITGQAHTGNACLEVIATAGGDMRVNRLCIPTTPVLSAGAYTVRFWARWLYGGNLILARGWDNAMARSLWMTVPRNLGTPGSENSATVKARAGGGSVNLGPVIGAVNQNPARPGGGEPVTITATISDADGVDTAAVHYRLGSPTGGAFTQVAMNDAGTGADSVAGDGIFSATLPGQNSGVKVVFFIEATDGASKTRRNPVQAPGRTLLYQTAGPMGGSLLGYRLSLDDNQTAELQGRQLHSDDPVYGTFVFDDSEVYYNVGLHYHGSPWNRPGSPRMYKLEFPGDRPFHGSTKFNISRYGSAQNEATAYYTIGRTGRIDAPSPHGEYRFIRFHINNTDQGNMSHVETVDRAYVSRWYPKGPVGQLLRANGRITFRLDEQWGLTNWASFTSRGNDKEAYRMNWDLHTNTLEDEWAPFIQLIRVMDPSITPTGPAYDTAIKEIADPTEFMRVLAVRALNDDWDAVGIGNGQNAYVYYALDEKRWKYLPWDMDHTYANAGATLLPTADPGIARMIGRPEFNRAYLQAMEGMLNTTWNEARLAPVLDPTEAAGVGNSGGIKAFVNARMATARATVGTPGIFRIRTNGGRDLTVATATTVLELEAPLALWTILVNGEPLPATTWVSNRVFRVTVPLPNGVNPFVFAGFDSEGNLAGTVSITITSTAAWNAPAISSIDPVEGPASGGTVVTIAGTEFHEGIKVSFAAAAASTIQLVSPTEVKATAPAGFGIVDLKVENTDGKAAVKVGAFTYLGPKFIRGDAAGGGSVDITDAQAILQYLFRDGALACLEAADANDDARVDLADAVRVLLYLFAAGIELPAPYPGLGSDPTPDALGCAAGV